MLESSGPPSNRWFLVVLCLVILCVIGVRLRLLDMPLERDEGEYAYAGQLILEGIPPYQLAYNVKLPGTYAAYAGMMAVFGQSPRGIHLGFLLAHVAALGFLYLIARRFLGRTGALVACVTHCLLAASPAVCGLAGHATQLVTLAALAGFWLLLKARESGRTAMFFWSGSLFGVAFLCKQPGLFFGLMGGAILLRDALETRPIKFARTIIFTLGWIVPLALVCAWLWRVGTFPQFWRWTVTYSRMHGTVMPPALACERVLNLIRSSKFDDLFWAVAVGGAVVLLREKARSDRKFLLLMLLGFSFLAVCPGLYFSCHYFIVMFPVVALLAGLALEKAIASLPPTRWSRVGPMILFVMICGGLAVEWREIWFELSPTKACQRLYKANPFVPAVEIARHIAEHTPANARIAVMGSEPEIYFYAHRHSATGYIYMYDLMAPDPLAHAMQLEAMHDIEAAKPEYIVMVKVAISWSVLKDSDRTVLTWTKQYINKNYEVEGYVVMIHDGYRIAWGEEEIRNIGVKSDCYVLVFKRKQNAG